MESGLVEEAKGRRPAEPVRESKRTILEQRSSDHACRFSEPERRATTFPLEVGREGG